MSQHHEAENIIGEGQQQVVIEDEHLEPVQLAERASLDGADVVVISLQVFQALQSHKGVLPERLQLVVVQVQSLEGAQAVEGPAADLLQLVVAQVQGDSVGVVDKLVGVEAAEQVAVEEELVDAGLWRQQQADTGEALVLTVDVQHVLLLLTLAAQLAHVFGALAALRLQEPSHC